MQNACNIKLLKKQAFLSLLLGESKDLSKIQTQDTKRFRNSTQRRKEREESKEDRLEIVNNAFNAVLDIFLSEID